MDNQAKANYRFRSLLELFFSLDIGFAVMSVVFCVAPSASIPFAHLEVNLNHVLGIKQTDYIRGYFEIWIPSLTVAACTWSLLRLFRRINCDGQFLRWAGGAILLFPPAVWTCGYLHNGWSLDWPYKKILLEPVFALICLFVVLNAPWSIARWALVTSFVTYCLYWYWFSSDGFHALEWGIPGYGGPYGLLVGTAAMFSWAMYILESRRTYVQDKR